jgi:hypothetical protein
MGREASPTLLIYYGGLYMSKAIPAFNPAEGYKLRLSNTVYEYEQNGFKYNAVGKPIDGQEVTSERPADKLPEEKIIAQPVEETKEEEKAGYLCLQCEETFDSQKKLDKHLKWHEEIGKIEENPITELQEEK